MISKHEESHGHVTVRQTLAMPNCRCQCIVRTRRRATNYSCAITGRVSISLFCCRRKAACRISGVYALKGIHNDCTQPLDLGPASVRRRSSGRIFGLWSIRFIRPLTSLRLSRSICNAFSGEYSDVNQHSLVCNVSILLRSIRGPDCQCPRYTHKSETFTLLRGTKLRLANVASWASFPSCCISITLISLDSS